MAKERQQLTRREEAALERVRKTAKVLDNAVEIPGTGIGVGLDPVLSVLPVAGDLTAAAISMYIVAEAARIGVPREKLLRMTFNVGVDVVGGSIPVLGTLVDTLWQANQYNVSHIEEHLGVDSEDR